jgi:hypothetical protein
MGSEVYPDVGVTNVIVAIVVPLLPFVNSLNAAQADECVLGDAQQRKQKGPTGCATSFHSHMLALSMGRWLEASLVQGQDSLPLSL